MNLLIGVQIQKHLIHDNLKRLRRKISSNKSGYLEESYQVTKVDYKSVFVMNNVTNSASKFFFNVLVCFSFVVVVFFGFFCCLRSIFSTFKVKKII